VVISRRGGVQVSTDGRTSDGLPLILGVAFQYRLDPAGLFDLYHTFGDDYKRVFHKVRGKFKLLG
jgi:hypothetical protein